MRTWIQALVFAVFGIWGAEETFSATFGNCLSSDVKIQTLRRAIAVTPDDLALYSELLRTLERAGRLDSAEARESYLRLARTATTTAQSEDLVKWRTFFASVDGFARRLEVPRDGSPYEKSTGWRSVALSGDGRTFFVERGATESEGDSNLRVLDLASGQIRKVGGAGFTGTLPALATNRDGSMILGSQQETALALIDAKSGEVLSDPLIPVEGGSITEVVLDSKGGVGFATYGGVATESGMILIEVSGSPRELHIVNRWSAPSRSVCQRLAISEGTDWVGFATHGPGNYNDFSEAYVLSPGMNSPRKLALSTGSDVEAMKFMTWKSDEILVASRKGKTGVIETYRLNDGGKASTLLELDSPARVVVASPDSRFLVTIHRDFTLRVWAMGGGAPKEVYRQTGMGTYEDPMTHMTIDPEGRIVVGHASGVRVSDFRLP